MIFCLAKKEDTLQIAKIHKTEINKGFLSSLSVHFLENLYSTVIVSNVSFCVVAKEDGIVVGFITGVTNLNKFYLYFLKKYFLQSVFILVPKFFNIVYIKKTFETLFYPVKEKKLPPAELLTMAVSSEFQGQGIASKMFLEFISEMKKRDVKIFKVLVGKELRPAIIFYEKNGFTFLKNISMHDNKISRVYVYDINQ